MFSSSFELYGRLIFGRFRAAESLTGVSNRPS
jgi:hypothetical protein